jgi:hypothetical protein
MRKKSYVSFFIRIWQPDERTQRIKIEHVQSGTSKQVSTLEAAITWIIRHWRETDSDGSPESESENTGDHSN